MHKNCCPMFVSKQRSKILTIFMTVAMTLFGACSRSNINDNSLQREWEYVPEVLEFDEKASFDSILLAGDFIYYFRNLNVEENGEQVLCRYSLTDKQITSIPLNCPDDSDSTPIVSFFVDGNYNIYVITQEEKLILNSNEDYETKWSLYKFDEKGNGIFSQDIITSSDNERPFSVAADEQERIYVAGDTSVWCYDAKGNVQGRISVGTSACKIVGMGCSGDGKVYVSYYDSFGKPVQLDQMDYSLAELDYENRRISTVYTDFPQCNSGRLSPGGNSDFLAFNDSSVYRYDLTTQTSELVLDWIDCNIEGAYAKILGVLEDDKIVAVQEKLDNKCEIILLTKTQADPETEKQVIVIGAMVNSNDLQAAIVEFNKTHDNYRIVVREYYGDSGDATWDDAVMRLNSDIVSGNCPDIICLTGLDVDLLAAKGVFEDLNPYLKNSKVLNREDFLEGILDAYTFDGVLTAIPSRFWIQTVVGSEAELSGGEKWTIEEVISFAEAHPDSVLFDKFDKSDIMEYLMRFNENLFIDWSTGECSFDSEEFKRLLEFVNSYSDEEEGKPDGLSEPLRIQKGEVLLTKEMMVALESAQVYQALFQGNVVYIGYPTPDGSSGHIISNANQIYGMTAKSDNKEGAWEFIEGVLIQESSRDYQSGTGFPVIKSQLEKEIWKSLNSGYVLDENGEFLLDENGEPIINTDFGTVSMGFVGGPNGFQEGWSYTYRPATQEEIDIVLKVIEGASLRSENNEGIMNIINEEAVYLYEGQKTVDEVAGTIQRRISVYVSEMM